MTLNTYFNYWDAFFKIWSTSADACQYEQGFLNLANGFQDSPFAFPHNLSNDLNGLQDSYDFIPEPYWGWTPHSKSDLKYVVINYNPGSGGDNQFKTSLNVQNISEYSTYVFEQLEKFVACRNQNNLDRPSQYDTTNWHFVNRAKKLVQVNEPELVDSFNEIHSYLGIDLVPWHTKNVSSLNGYLQLNFEAIKMWSLNFAIEAAKQVKGCFHNIVIVRTNFSTFRSLFSSEFENGFFTEGDAIVGDLANGNDHCQKINIVNSDVTIYLLWGMRNSLPTNLFMDIVFH